MLKVMLSVWASDMKAYLCIWIRREAALQNTGKGQAGLTKAWIFLSKGSTRVNLALKAFFYDESGDD